MRRLLFYLNYAARNLRRNTRWTTFAVFCIAAGVATVVALRSLGLGDWRSLADNVRLNNHGDITISYVNTMSIMLPRRRGGANNDGRFHASTKSSA